MSFEVIAKQVRAACTQQARGTRAGHHKSVRSEVAIDGARHTGIVFTEHTAAGQQVSVPRAKMQVSTCSS